jgi:hypothetical protein
MGEENDRRIDSWQVDSRQEDSRQEICRKRIVTGWLRYMSYVDRTRRHVAEAGKWNEFIGKGKG